MVGATFVPVILGSDKTTVSVGTGNNEYYPLYLSIGNVRNNVCRAHRDAIAVIGFLAMPKSKAHSIFMLITGANSRFYIKLHECTLRIRSSESFIVSYFTLPFQKFFSPSSLE
jgi:hypothetical protein